MPRQIDAQTKYSVFGRIDFFSVLKYLVVSLGGSLDMDCVLLAPEIFKVSRPLVDSRVFYLQRFSQNNDFLGYKKLPIGHIRTPHVVSGTAHKLEVHR